MLTVLDAVLWLCSVPVLVMTGYLFLLTLASARGRVPAPPTPKLKFDFIVPAHNEQDGIAQTVQSLSKVDYPPTLRRILVVADNCSDATAERAQAAGATVLVRVDTERRGKGYALEHAFERSLADGVADAVVVVDADTQVSPNLLHAFGARLEAGARAVQADYAVANRDASWRTRLMAIALGMFHILRSLGRERLGVSCGLRGNGMCFHHDLLRQVPHKAFSLVEDLEYGMRLARAGFRVVYAEEAHVYGEMVSTEKASRSQRERWEHGRALIARDHGLPLLRDGLAKRSPLLLDLAADVLVPPLSAVVGLTGVGLVVAAVGSFFRGAPLSSSYPFALATFFIAAYVLRGWWLSGSGLRGLADLAFAPFYLAWKLSLKLRGGKKKGEWVRTTRESESR